ncbi:MAG: hypothetical protein Q8R37_01930 [Nanoarchaeota archaeon]|nr:hypothetical protein [Nanoarchaeota archaeon]
MALLAVPLEALGVDVDTILQPMIDLLQPYLEALSFIGGGILILYVVLLIMRVRYERQKVKILKDIRYDLDQLNMHYGVRHSAEKKGFLTKALQYLKGTKYKAEENPKNGKKQ